VETSAVRASVEFSGANGTQNGTRALKNGTQERHPARELSPRLEFAQQIRVPF
jgi:hypothetical protein